MRRQPADPFAVTMEHVRPKLCDRATGALFCNEKPVVPPI